METFCWGLGENGQLGDGNQTSSTVPVAVTGAHHFVELSAAGSTTWGRIESGEVHCWGLNHEGQFGNGGSEGSGTPVLAETGT